jgi:beta-fructofuranosidase
MYRHIFYSFIFLYLLSITPIYAQNFWSFDNNTPLKSNDSTSLILHSIRNYPELVEGIKGDGIRTDGYTTWLTANFIPSKRIAAISGWFALESFPTDTAAFYGIRNAHKETVSVCTDRFGKIVVGIGDGKTFTYIPTNGQVERFKWLHVCLEDSPKGLKLYLNGKKLEAGQSIKVSLAAITDVQIGRDFRTKKTGMYDVTAINGLIDELRLHTQAPNANYAKEEFGLYYNKTPKLAIPASRFANDFSRPKYHLLPAANWTNETHGFFYYSGKYHIFNQKNASNLFLGQINWGHFSSDDLVNWAEHKPAITPEPGYDYNGIWSGHAVIDDNQTPVLIYTTGGEKMGVGLAYPKEESLIEWRKYEKNPVIWGQPDGYTRTDLRDPYVWKEKDVWYMIIGFGVAENNTEKGAVLLYKSKNLKDWQFIHTLFEGNPDIDDSGIFWEMPVFWKMDDKYILLVNKVPQRGAPARAFYWVGDFVDERFVPDNPIPHNLEVINRLLSPSVTLDKEGRTTTIAIIPDEIGSRAAYKHGWTHLYSIPRVWNLQNGKIEQIPHPALQQLRAGEKKIAQTLISEKSPLILNKGDQQLEIKATIYPDKADRYGFTIHKNPDNSEYTSIYYDAVNKEMVVDQAKSSLKKDIPLRKRKGAYPLTEMQPVDFHIYIDGSVVEVFINGKDAFTTRIFPLRNESNQVEVFTEGGDIRVEAAVWKLKAAQIEADF